MLRSRLQLTLRGARVAPPRSNLGPRLLPLLQRPMSSIAAQPSSEPVSPQQPHKPEAVPSLQREKTASQLSTPEITPASVSLYTKDQNYQLLFSDAKGEQLLRIHVLWFRDKCLCPRCVDPDSGQKNFSTTDIADKPEVESVKLTETGDLRIVWKNDAPSGDALHETVFGAEEVRGWMVGLRSLTDRYLPVRRTLWDRTRYEKLFSHGFCRITYEDWVGNDKEYWRAFEYLARTGLIVLTGVPETETAVETIAERVGEIQHTFYGRTWDVRSKPQAENVAYTSVFLGLHQDLMYHEPIPRLQFLHCLANSCEGGESLFSDGVRAAYELKMSTDKSQRTHYDVLEQGKVIYHYDKRGHYYHAARNVISRPNPADRIECTHWAPPFQAPFSTDKSTKPGERRFSLVEWKRAAAEFQKIIEAPENMVEMKLQPGECVIFDNQRVLHGRRAFAAGEGHRWLKGTYVSGQVFEAREREFQQKFGTAQPAVRENKKVLARAEARQAGNLGKSARQSNKEE